MLAKDTRAKDTMAKDTSAKGLRAKISYGLDTMAKAVSYTLSNLTYDYVLFNS